MKTTLLVALALLSSACATARPASRFADLDDQQIARLAVQAALGEVAAINEQAAFDARLEQALRSKLTGQAPVIEQLADACAFQQKKGHDVWPRDSFKVQPQCSWADASITLHSLWKKPRLHLVYVNTLLDVVNDPDFSLDALNALSKMSPRG